MTRSELFSLILIPVGLIAEFKWMSWPLLAAGVVWLLTNRITKVANFYDASLIVWWIIFLLGLVCAFALMIAFFGAPDGADRLPYFALFLVSLPVLIAWFIILFLWPRSYS